MSLTRASDYTYVDMFCGAGGSSAGYRAAGLRLVQALNHWDLAIETHGLNFPDAEHICADVNVMDKRRMMPAHIFHASPICTELSPSGGRKRARKAVKGEPMFSLEEYGHVPREGYERTRATFWDVIQATEVHRYPIVIVENVPDAAEWELIGVWEAAMVKLGYHMQVIDVDAAHVSGPGNDPAPQWRGRRYWFFTRNDLKPIPIEITPDSWCFYCERIVAGRQQYKRADARAGKYGSNGQYLYNCPDCRRPVEPLVLPALSALDTDDLGVRLADKKLKKFTDKKTGEEYWSPLARNSMQRLRAGYEMFGPQAYVTKQFSSRNGGYDMSQPIDHPLGSITTRDHHSLVVPISVTLNHDGDARAFPTNAGPLPSRTVKIGEAILTPLGGTWRTTSTSASEPMPARTTSETDALLSWTGAMRAHDTPQLTAAAPLRTISAGGNHAYLVVPYRRGARPYRAESGPLSTVATREQHGVMTTDDELMDCRFRMLKPIEHGRAQRFRDDYKVLGNGSEQTMQYGNAVASNVTQFLGTHAIRTLDGAA